LLARRKHPGSPNRLDDLCARYSIDNSRRVKHGALLDAEILAEVYLELIGGRQAQLILVESGNDNTSARTGRATVIRPRPMALLPRLTEEDRAAHATFLASLGDHAIWRDYLRVGA
jgi:DNA polymerase-3 subunit epsilon